MNIYDIMHEFARVVTEFIIIDEQKEQVYYYDFDVELMEECAFLALSGFLPRGVRWQGDHITITIGRKISN